MKRLHIQEATEQGFTIDHSAAGRPWAYKGARFSPGEACECYTELETELMATIEDLRKEIRENDATIENLQLHQRGEDY